MGFFRGESELHDAIPPLESNVVLETSVSAGGFSLESLSKPPERKTCLPNVHADSWLLGEVTVSYTHLTLPTSDLV